MRKSRIVIAAALVLGVAAAVPGGPRLAYESTIFSATEAEHPGGGAHLRRGADPTKVYRPCRPGPGDDRCIQLYERGVREALAARGGHVRTAALRPCRPGPGDDRCIQLYERRVRAALASRGHRGRVATPAARRRAAAAPVARRRVAAAPAARQRVVASRPPVARARTVSAVRRTPMRPAACARLLTDDCVARFDRARARSRNREPSTPGI